MVSAMRRHATLAPGLLPGSLPACNYDASWREPADLKPQDIYRALACDYYGVAPFPPSPRYPPRQESVVFNCSSLGYAYLFYGRFQGPFPGLYPSCRRDPQWCPISDMWSSENDRLATWRRRPSGARAIDAVDQSSRRARERLHDVPAQIFSSIPCSVLRRCPGLQSFEFFGPQSRRLLACVRNQRLVMLGDSTLAEVRDRSPPPSAD